MARVSRDTTRPVRAPSTPSSPEPHRRRFRVPTSAIVTLVAAVLTVLILPAVTRQWDDRRRAHELKAALVEEMAETTARALGDSVSHLTTDTSELPIQSRWNIDSLRIGAKLSAYFSENIVVEWQRHRTRVNSLIRIAGIQSPVPRRITGVEMVVSVNLAKTIIGSEADSRGYRYWLGTALDVRNRIALVGNLAERIILLENDVAGEVLRADPAGFSTTREDLLQDLLPG